VLVSIDSEKRSLQEEALSEPDISDSYDNKRSVHTKISFNKV
jgi:hypothetical protein